MENEEVISEATIVRMKKSDDFVHMTCYKALATFLFFRLVYVQCQLARCALYASGFYCTDSEETYLQLALWCQSVPRPNFTTIELIACLVCGDADANDRLHKGIFLFVVVGYTL